MDVNSKNKNLIMSKRFKKKVLNDWISTVKNLNIIKMKTSGVKTEKIMKKFGLTNSELSIILKNRNKYMKLKKSFFSPFSKMKTIMAMSLKYKKLERRLLTWVEELRNQKLPLDQSTFKKKAMDWYEEMGTSYPFRACNRWVRHFQQTHNVKVTFEANENEQKEDKAVQIKPNSEIKDNQSETKEDEATVSDQGASVNEKNEENKELIKEKEEFLSKLFLFHNKNTAVIRKETDEQKIQKDAKWKINEEIRVKVVEIFKEPISRARKNFMIKDDAKTTNSITVNRVFPSRIIENKKEERKLLALESNESLMNVFDHSDDLDGKEKEEEFLESQCDFPSTAENSTKNVNDKKHVCQQKSSVPKKLKDKSNEKQKTSVLKEKFEKRLLKWLKKARNNGITVRNQLFSSIALKYYKQSGIPYYFTASHMWIRRFEKRHNIKICEKMEIPSKRTRLYLSRNSKTRGGKINQNKKNNEVEVMTKEKKKARKKEKKVTSLTNESDQSEELDKHLLNWLTEMRSQSFEVSGKKFLKKALKLYKSSGYTYYFKANYYWIYSFEKRYNIQIIRRNAMDDSKKHQINHLDSLEKPLVSNKTDMLSNEEIETKGKKDKMEKRDGEDKKILELQCQKQDSGESNCSEDKNSDTQSILMTRQSVIRFHGKVNAMEEKVREKPSSIISFDYEDISNDCDLASTGDSVFDSSSSSSCSQFGVNSIRMNEYIKLLNKGLIQKEKVHGEVRDDWKEEVVKIPQDEVEYRRDYEPQELKDGKQNEEKEEEELEHEQEENVKIKDLEVEGTEISECGIKEVNVIDVEKNVKEDDVVEYDGEKIVEEKMCKEEKEKNEEVGAEEDENNGSFLCNLLIRLDVPEKLVLDKSKEERNVDKEKQADAVDMEEEVIEKEDKKDEENLTDEQVKVKKDLATNGKENEKDKKEVAVEKNEDGNSSSCSILIHSNVSEKLTVNETGKKREAYEEKEMKDKGVKLATIEVIFDEIKEVIVVEYEEEVEHITNEKEVKLDDKDVVTNDEEDQENEGRGDQKDMEEEMDEEVEKEAIIENEDEGDQKEMEEEMDEEVEKEAIIENEGEGDKKEMEEEIDEEVETEEIIQNEGEEDQKDMEEEIDEEVGTEEIIQNKGEEDQKDVEKEIDEEVGTEEIIEYEGEEDQKDMEEEIDEEVGTEEIIQNKGEENQKDVEKEIDEEVGTEKIIEYEGEEDQKDMEKEIDKGVGTEEIIQNEGEEDQKNMENEIDEEVGTEEIIQNEGEEDQKDMEKEIDEEVEKEEIIQNEGEEDHKDMEDEIDEEVEKEAIIEYEVKNLETIRDRGNEVSITADRVDNLEIEKNKEETGEQKEVIHVKQKKETFKHVSFATDVEIIDAPHLPADEVDNLEFEEIKEKTEEQEEATHVKQKKETSKHVSFATDVEIINARQSPADYPSLQSSSIMKPVNKSTNMEEYSEILEYKLVFNKCKQFVKDENIRKYFTRQQIKEFQQALDTLIKKAASEDNLLHKLLMNKNWAPFGRMFCSGDIAWVFENKIICTFCYEDDNDEYKNYSKSSFNHKLTLNKKLRGRICNQCKGSTVDFRPAAKCIECIIPFWRRRSYYKLLFCNETGNLGMSSEHLILIDSILSNIHNLEY